MTSHARPSRTPRPLDEERLRALALAYVGRFATTRAKLTTYLARKLRERGWAGAGEPAIGDLVERLVGLGYVDDAAYALSKARSLGLRGYGVRRVDVALRQAGVGEDDGQAARDAATSEAVASAVRFAQRKRIGPFAIVELDRPQQERGLAALIRAGHGFDLSRRLATLRADPASDAQEIVKLLISSDC